MPLQLHMLRFVRHIRARIIAQCPACAEIGADRRGRNHLIIWPDGRFACVAHPGDREHRRRIWALARDHTPRLLALGIPWRRLPSLIRKGNARPIGR